MNTSRICTALVVATAATSLGLTACGSSSTTTAAPTSTASTVSTSSATSSMAQGMPMPSAPAGSHNAADITFASMMLVHHKGAITMAELAPDRASDPQVKALAVKIKAEQAPEITTMTGWLSAWQPATDMNGKPMSTSSSMAMGSMGSMNSGSGATAGMPGMMTDQQMAQLMAAKGADFDKMFLTMMIAHHKGALEMANTEKSSGANPAALALANSIVTSQAAEVTTMQDLLKTL